MLHPPAKWISGFSEALRLSLGPRPHLVEQNRQGRQDEEHRSFRLVSGPCGLFNVHADPAS